MVLTCTSHHSAIAITLDYEASAANLWAFWMCAALCWIHTAGVCVMSCSVAISSFLRHEVSFWVCGSAILSTGEYRAYRLGTAASIHPWTSQTPRWRYVI